MEHIDEKIDEVYKLGYSIEKLYKELCNLEMNGQKDTSEYQTYFDYLKIALEVEEDYYQRTFNTFDKSSQYFVKTFDATQIADNDIDSIIKQKYDDKVSRRIINRLKVQISKSYDYLPQNKIKKQIKHNKLLDTNLAMVNCFRSNILCNEECYLTFLSFLHIFISKIKKSYYKEMLIKTKYYIAYINRDVESALLDNNFNIYIPAIQNANFKAYLTAIPTNEYRHNKDEFVFKHAYREMLQLIKISDEDYQNTNIGLSAIIRLCF